MKIDKGIIWLDIQNIGINVIISIIFFIPVYFLIISAFDLFAEKLVFLVLWFMAINCMVYIGRCMWHCGY